MHCVELFYGVNMHLANVTSREGLEITYPLYRHSCCEFKRSCYLHASRFAPGQEKLLAEQHYGMLCYMSPVGSVIMVAMVGSFLSDELRCCAYPSLGSGSSV